MIPAAVDGGEPEIRVLGGADTDRVGSQYSMKVDIQTALTQTNQSGGIHAYQVMYGCELRDDGTTGRFEQYGWEGNDLVNFDMVWVTLVHWGESTKHNWDWNTAGNQQRKGFLEQECITWLKKYLKAGEGELRATAPAVSFTHLGDARRLPCVTTGFYPQAIEVTLWRDGKFLNETLSSGILHNHDGTDQINRWTEFDPEDQGRFSCEVEHNGPEEKVGMFYLPKPGSQVPIVVGVMLGLLVLLVILAIVVVVI
uniref:major histocompatibility complex class I-related gene protein-like n=1 Tax=Pristiophorus japonicus TaxID=55135 RepID=UPI00398E539C